MKLPKSKDSFVRILTKEEPSQVDLGAGKNSPGYVLNGSEHVNCNPQLTKCFITENVSVQVSGSNKLEYNFWLW